MKVALTWPEMRHAAYIGIDRYVRALSSNWAPLDGQRRDDWAAHILGALGECVIAKASGFYWTGDLGHADKGAPDVGPFHVRTSIRPDASLILHPRDSDEEPFVLVVAMSLPVFRIAGWLNGSEGKLSKYSRTFDERVPAYFVPQSALHEWEET